MPWLPGFMFVNIENRILLPAGYVWKTKTDCIRLYPTTYIVFKTYFSLPSAWLLTIAIKNNKIKAGPGRKPLRPASRHFLMPPPLS